MEGDRQIITELNGDDVTKCVIVEGVNHDADRARAEWPWLFLGHLIANVKFRCGHSPCSERFKCRPRPNRYINNCWRTRLQKYRDNYPGTHPTASAPGGCQTRKNTARDSMPPRQSLHPPNSHCR